MNVGECKFKKLFTSGSMCRKHVIKVGRLFSRVSFYPPRSSGSLSQMFSPRPPVESDISLVGAHADQVEYVRLI